MRISHQRSLPLSQSIIDFEPVLERRSREFKEVTALEEVATREGH